MIIFSSQEMQEAAELLKKGELVAFPTETVYGLGALVTSEEALKKIYIAKGRPSDNPLIVHLADIYDVLHVAVDIPQSFWELAAVFSPGPLTFILKKAAGISSIISAGLDTIALRFPSHPTARELIKRAGSPIAAPSANLSGKPSSTTVAHIIDDFEGKIAGVIEGGQSPLGLESTVINLTATTPVILRPGSITKEMIEEVLRVDVEDKPKEQALLSPGMKYRHYAPKTPIKLFTCEEEFLFYLEHARKKAVVASKNKGYDHFFPLTAELLYATLRKLDDLSFEEIVIFCDAEVARNAALMNRLWHACQ